MSNFYLITAITADITPEDCARWFPGTNVAWDRMLEVDGFAPQAFSAVTVDESKVQPYHMEAVPREDGSIFGLNAAIYELWAGNAVAMPGEFRVDDLLGMLYRETCPLAGVMGFDSRQSEVPVAAEYWRPVWSAPIRVVSREELRREYEDARLRYIGANYARDRSAPATTRETVGAAHRRIVKRAPAPLAKPSRVPDVIREKSQRLDGRRR